MKTPLYIIAASFGALSLTTAQQYSASSAVQEAWQNRPAIKAAAALVEEAKATRSSASAFPATTLHLGVANNSNVDPDDKDLALVQHLDVFGRTRAATHTAETLVRLAEVELHRAKLSVQSEVIVAHSAVVASTRRLALATELRDLAQQLLHATQRRFELGDIAEVNVIRARIEFDRADQVVELRESELEEANKRFAGALGQLDIQTQELGDFVEMPATEDWDLAHSLPDLMTLAHEADYADARARELNLSSRPDLSFEVRRSPWVDSIRPTFRLQLSFPIFDSNRARNDIRAARLRQEAALHQFRDTLFLAEANLEAAWIHVHAADSQVERSERLVDDARELVAITSQGFERGVLTLVETLEANRALREVEESLVEAEYRRALAIEALLRAGGQLVVTNR